MDSNNIIFCFYLKIIKRVSHKKEEREKKISLKKIL